MTIAELFQQTVLSGSMLLAIPFAAVAGLVSFASPCVLPLVPGYLGYVSGMAGGAAGGRVAVGAGARSGSGGAPGAGAPGAGADATGGAGAGSLPSGSRAGGPPSTDGRLAAAAAAAAAGSGASSGVGPPGPTPALAAAPRGRVLAGVALFVAGFTVVFVLFGSLAGGLGGLVAQWSDPITRVLGVVVVGMGLAFLGWVPWAQRERRLHLAPRAGLWGAPLLGLTFGLGWIPCIGPTLVAVYTLALDEASAGRGAVLSVAYCLGLGLPFLLVALGLDRSQRALALLRRHRLAVMRTGGAVLLLVGLALVTGLWGAWTQSLQGLIGGFTTVV